MESEVIPPLRRNIKPVLNLSLGDDSARAMLSIFSLPAWHEIQDRLDYEYVRWDTICHDANTPTDRWRYAQGFLACIEMFERWKVQAEDAMEQVRRKEKVLDEIKEVG